MNSQIINIFFSGLRLGIYYGTANMGFYEQR